MNTAINKTGEIIREQKENLTEHYDKLRMTQVKVIEPCSQKSVKVGTMIIPTEVVPSFKQGLKTHVTINLGHSNYYLCFTLPEHDKTYQSVRKKKESEKNKPYLNMNRLTANQFTHNFI